MGRYHINHTLTLWAAACRRWKSRAIVIMYMAAILHLVGDLLRKQPQPWLEKLSADRSDVVMALPIAMLRTLQMRTREKIGLAVIFALVLIEVAFTILRVVFTVSHAFGKVPDLNTLWSTLDPIIAVMVCTLPCYRNLLSFDRRKSISRTPEISFGSSKFTNGLKSTGSSGRKGSSIDMQINGWSTDRFSYH